MSNILSDYYRASVVPKSVSPSGSHTNRAGFFHFGPERICYGQCASGVSADASSSKAFDASQSLAIFDSVIHLPFDIQAVIENLRRERYVQSLYSGEKPLTQSELVRKAYYFVREYLPVWIRRHMQRAYFKGWQNLPFPHWPIDFTVDSLHEEFLRMTMVAQGLERVPFIWFWPEGATSCLILTHDVEREAGLRFCSSLMGIDAAHGFSSSFQVVPESRYQVPESFIDEIRSRGFEFNIHDLNHDGQLFQEKSEFLVRAGKINQYAKRYGALGFRSGAMYRNLDWYEAFKFSYDMSVPNVAHLEPQRGGCCTVMPFFVGKILELPLTATQDYALFHILNDYSLDLWKEQIDSIQRRNGLVSFIAHPDYLIPRGARRVYESLLELLRKRVERNKTWEALPREVDCWWRARAEMTLVPDGKGFQIVGPESHRARLAYATLIEDRVVYTVEEDFSKRAGADETNDKQTPKRPNQPASGSSC